MTAKLIENAPSSAFCSFGCLPGEVTGILYTWGKRNRAGAIGDGRPYCDTT
jgi:hypothetical protein